MLIQLITPQTLLVVLSLLMISSGSFVESLLPLSPQSEPLEPMKGPVIDHHFDPHFQSIIQTSSDSLAETESESHASVVVHATAAVKSLLKTAIEASGGVVTSVRVTRGSEPGTIGLELELEVAVLLVDQAFTNTFAGPGFVHTPATHTAAPISAHSGGAPGPTIDNKDITISRTVGMVDATWPLIKVTGDLQFQDAPYGNTRTLEIITGPVSVGRGGAVARAELRDLERAFAILLQQFNAVNSISEVAAGAALLANAGNRFFAVDGPTDFLWAATPRPQRLRYCGRDKRMVWFGPANQLNSTYLPLFDTILQPYNLAIAGVPIGAGGFSADTCTVNYPFTHGSATVVHNGRTYVPYVSCASDDLVYARDNGGHPPVAGPSHLQVNYALPLYVVGLTEASVNAVGGGRRWFGSIMGPAAQVILKVSQAIANDFVRVRPNTNMGAGLGAAYDHWWDIHGYKQKHRHLFPEFQEDVAGLLTHWFMEIFMMMMRDAREVRKSNSMAGGQGKNLRDQLIKACTNDLLRAITPTATPKDFTVAFRAAVPRAVIAGTIITTAPWQAMFNRIHSILTVARGDAAPAWPLAAYRNELRQMMEQSYDMSFVPHATFVTRYPGETDATFGTSVTHVLPHGWSCAAGGAGANLQKIRPIDEVNRRISVIVEHRLGGGPTFNWNDQFRPTSNPALNDVDALLDPAIDIYMSLLLN